MAHPREQRGALLTLRHIADAVVAVVTETPLEAQQRPEMSFASWFR